jgi:acetoin utilization protein AcuB
MKIAPSIELASPARPLTVGNIMSRRVITITMDDNLAKAQELFHEFRFHHLLVLEHRQLVGVISDRDLLKAISPNIGTLSETDRDRATLNKRAHQIMSRNPVTVKIGTPIETAARLLIEKKVSCLPIINDGNELEGILSWKDILNALVPPASPPPP